MEGIRGGFREAMAQPSRKVKEPERKARVSEMLSAIGGAAKKSSTDKAMKYAEKLKTGGRDLDRETFLKMQAEDRRKLLTYRQMIDAEMRQRGYRLTPQKGDRAARASRSGTKFSGDKEYDLTYPELAAKVEATLAALATQAGDTPANRTDFSYHPPLTVNFTTVTANLTSGVRRETLQGREYLVAPLTMIVPGVLAGSKGPLYYPEAEVKKNPTAWNGMPIVVNHPMVNGIPVEARSPGVLDKQQIGTVFNARYKGKLVAEGWFDVDRTRQTNIGIYEQLINNKPIELSTGLYTDNEPYRGVWNGREYHYVARNYRPDHLAILIGSRGACSIKDGCGVLINKCGGSKPKKKFKLIRNSLTHPRVRSITEFINNSYWKAAKAVGEAARLAGGQAAKDIARMGGPRSAAVKGARKATSGVVKFTRKRPKTALAITGVGGYQLGKRKKQVHNAKPEKYKTAKRVGGAVGGFGAGMAGTVAGAELGARIGKFGGPKGLIAGTAIGGLVGGASGAWGGGRVARRVSGETAGQAADLGGLAGTIATPGGLARGAGRLIGRGGAKVAASQAAKPVAAQVVRSASPGAVRLAKAKRLAKSTAIGTGKLAGGVAVYEGTTQGLDAAERGLSKKRRPVSNTALIPRAGVAVGTRGFRGLQKELGKVKKPRIIKPVMNWTEEARRKSAETRKRKALLKGFEGAEETHRPYTGIRNPLAAVAVGAAAGTGSRIGGETVMRGINRVGGAIGGLSSKAVQKESFDLPFEELVRKAKEAKPFIKKAGVGRRVAGLLGRIGRRIVFKR
jgi:hypothetical protein